MARFSLADVERPDEPFEIEGEGDAVYTLAHPQSLPAEVLLDLDPTDYVALFRLLLGDEDFAGLMAEPEMDGFALEAMFGKYAEHFGLLADLGEGVASPRSSSGTARRSKPTSRSASKTRTR